MLGKSLLHSNISNAVTKRLFYQKRFLATTQVAHLNQKWRQERGLPLNPNAHGVLTDGPDYSFLDGRPTPPGVGQMRRILQQKQIAEQIIKLTGEIDFAVVRHERLQQEENEKKQRILDNKLRPKGTELLKKKK